MVSLFGCKVPELPDGDVFGLLRVMWNGDAATEATIGWSSLEKDADQQMLHLDTVDHGQDVDAYRASYPVALNNSSFGMTNNFVRLQNLFPDTKYYFVISQDDQVSRRYWFQTASNRNSDRLSLVIGGDSRNNKEVRRLGNKLVAKLRPHAVLFGGDYTQFGTESQWKQWLIDWQMTIAEDGRITPLVAARGNHENNNEMMVDLFDTATGVYYTTHIGGDLLRVYTLNTEISIAGNQTDWFKAELQKKSSNSIWKIAQYHQAVSPHTKGKKEREQVYAYWAPLFYEYGVDLISESDSHTMKTTFPVRPTQESGNDNGFVRDDKYGSIYIGEGCWGAPLRADDDLKSWTRTHGKINHFHWVFLDRNSMEIRTVQFDNAEEVGALTDATRFSMPANIKLFTANNESVIRRQK